MKWNFIKAQPSSLNLESRTLKFDGVNDNVLISNDNFYNVDKEDFSILIRIMIVESQIPQDSTGSLIHESVIFLSKNVSQGNGFWVGISGKENQGSFVPRNSTPRHLTFRYTNLDGSTGAMYLETPFVRGSFKNIYFERSGADFTIKDLSANESYTHTYDSDASLLNIAPLTISSQSGANFYKIPGYLSQLGFYNRKLTNQELINFNQFGNLPFQSAKFASNSGFFSGKAYPDISSINNNGILQNYTDLETGIPNVATNRVWLNEDGIFYFDSLITKTFIASKDLTISKIGRGYNNSSTARATHKRNGIVLQTYDLNFSSSNLEDNLNIAMLNMDELELEILTFNDGPLTLELFY